MYQLLSLGVMSLDNVGHGADLIEPITPTPSTSTGSLHNQLQNWLLYSNGEAQRSMYHHPFYQLIFLLR